LLPRDRIDALLDKNSPFLELSQFAGLFLMVHLKDMTCMRIMFLLVELLLALVELMGNFSPFDSSLECMIVANGKFFFSWSRFNR
jgi:hypothetical protein